MKKRVLSFMLTAILCFGLCVGFTLSASAAESGYISTIATGYSCSFAVKSDGTLWAWGSASGIGAGTNTDRLTPVKVLDDVKEVYANTHGSYAIKNDNSLWSNYSGLTPELKNQNKELQYGDAVRTWYKITDDVKQVCGDSMFIKNDNSLWAWGTNTCGRMGLGADKASYEGHYVDDFDAPIKIMDGVKTAYSRDNTTMVIKLDGSLWGAGLNVRGNLGDGTLTDRYSFVKIMDGVQDVHIGNSGNHNQTMILKNDGSLWMCGSNFTGQFGNGNYTDRDTFTSTPVKVMDGVKSISAGSWCSFIIKQDNSLWGCGSVTYGQLGLGEMSSSVLSFTKIMDDVADISSHSHTLILKLDGSLWACGSNSCGEIGDGTVNSQPTPNGPKLRDHDKWNPVKVLDGVKLTTAATTATPTPTQPSTPALTAKPTASTVLVNGENVAFDAYNISGNNYFKLRDLAYILSGTEKQFDVGWDGANNAISLTSDKAYAVVGGEMTGKGAGDKTPTATSSKIYLDGKEVQLTAYNIEGNNYFKLRDIGEAFDFGVDWDGANNTIVIDTSKGYTPD